MVQINNEINEGIFEGYFPSIELFQMENYTESRQNDFFYLGEADLRNYIFPFLEGRFSSSDLSEARKMKQAYEENPGRDDSFSELFFLINTKYWMTSFFNAQFCQKACEICPFVTEIEWGLAVPLAFGMELGEGDVAGGILAHLIRIIQDKELKSGKTINVELLEDNGCDLYSIIMGDWCANESYLKDLSKEEKDILCYLDSEREEFDVIIEEEIRKEEIIAKITEKSWKTLVDLINRLSRNETETVKTILASNDISEKKALLESHFALYEDIQNGLLPSGERFDWEKVSTEVIERFEKAKRFCCVTAREKRTFILLPSIVKLVEKPYSYNSVFLLYHKFRLSHSFNDADVFFKALLEGVARNLMYEIEDDYSIEEVCEEVVNCFEEITEDESVLASISYDDIQRGVALSTTIDEGAIPGVVKLDKQRIFNGIIHSELPEMEAMIGNDKTTELTQIMLEKKETIKGQIQSTFEKEYSNEISEEKAIQFFIIKQLIHSIDLLYLCCDAIKIILADQPKEKFNIVNLSRFEEIRSELLDYDEIIVRGVYGSKARKVREFREKAGIKSDLLSERERNNSNCFNELQVQEIVEAFSNCIDNAIAILNQCSEEDIQRRRNEILQREISYLPMRISFDLVESKLELLNKKISEKLIRSRVDGDDFQIAKNALIDYFDDRSAIIPENALNTFATAELLYNKYATEVYATRGFDYSSISALYYQAFETLYNELLWSPYANKVNGLVINGRRFVEQIGILWEPQKNWSEEQRKECRRVEEMADKYFNSSYSEKSNYAERKDSLWMIKTTCTYRNFAKILSESISGDGKRKQLRHSKFAEFIAISFGYQSSFEMRKDSSFIYRLGRLAEEIRVTANDRNNASHGGELITIEQCTKDKSRVLNKIENERVTSLGLALQLLGLYGGRG